MLTEDYKKSLVGVARIMWQAHGYKGKYPPPTEEDVARVVRTREEQGWYVALEFPEAHCHDCGKLVRTGSPVHGSYQKNPEEWESLPECVQCSALEEIYDVRGRAVTWPVLTPEGARDSAESWGAESFRSLEGLFEIEVHEGEHVYEGVQEFFAVKKALKCLELEAERAYLDGDDLAYNAIMEGETWGKLRDTFSQWDMSKASLKCARSLSDVYVWLAALRGTGVGKEFVAWVDEKIRESSE